jgi:hypothetical protein
LPESIKNKLFEFQKEGITYGIQKKAKFLLADEMVKYHNSQSPYQNPYKNI